MFLLRRAAVRSVQSAAYISKPRTFVTSTPSIFRAHQLQVSSSFQRRFLSTDDVKEKVEETYESVKESAENAYEKVKDAATTGADKVESVVQPDNTSVYCGNLFFNVTTDELREHFQQFGEILDARVISDPDGRSKGFGFIHFKEPESAQKAIEEMDQQDFKGRALNVQLHKPRPAVARNGVVPQNNSPTKTLFVGNMSFQMTDKDLNDLFKNVNNLLDVRVAIDRATGQPRGFAHADFIDEASATAAKELLEEKEVFGRNLKVNYARPATPRETGGRPSGGRDNGRGDFGGGRRERGGYGGESRGGYGGERRGGSSY